jgi:hypothetical protein
MRDVAPIPYEPPTITTYGTVQELTFGTGSTTTADAESCAQHGFNSNTPSLVTCKTNA